MCFRKSWLITGLWIPLLSAQLGPTAIAAPAPNGKQFMKGGTFCFSLTQPALPQWHETLKLVVQPTVKGQKQQLPLITGLQHGVLTQSSPPFEYISQITGTASYDLPRTSLQISLTSNQAGADLEGKQPGIWIGNMAFKLAAHDLSGQAIGTKVFKPVYEGKVHGETIEDAVDGQLRSIACTGF